VEGGLMKRRLQWDAGLTLRQQVDVECFQSLADASWLLELMRNDLDVLNGVRADVFR
jgi:hypothetical protein